MNRNRKKAAAATLAAGMAVVLGAGTVMAAASTGDNGLQKEETVYVNTTAGGEVTDVTVSDWLKNSGDSSNSEVKDASDLQDIKNVKITATPIINNVHALPLSNVTKIAIIATGIFIYPKLVAH